MRMEVMPHERSTSAIVGAPLTTQIESELTRMIATRRLEPGVRVREGELAEMFGTSRIPVREALRQLSERGLVVYVQRRGYYIRQLTLPQAEDLYRLRFALDRLAIEQAVGHPDASGYTGRLAPLIEELSVAVEERDIPHVINADLDFHRSVAELSGNESLINIYARVTDPVRPVLARMVPAELDSDFVTQHQRLASAIRPGGIREAIKALKAHNAFALELLRALMSREGDIQANYSDPAEATAGD